MKTRPQDPINAATFLDGDGQGLTKREYIAAMAMQGMLSNAEITEPNKVRIAPAAVQCADALIAALNEDAE